MPITIDGSGTITGASTLATTVASPTLTTPNINSAQFATVTGTAPIYPCRAWVNFNGTGTVAIRASGNVSSITDNGVGDYTVNFTTAMPDASYSVGGMGPSDAANNSPGGISIASATTGGAPYLMTSSQIRVKTGFGSTTAAYDFNVVAIQFFR